MCVQKKTQKSLPRFEFLSGKRLEELAANDQLSFQTAGLALAFLCAQGFKANEGLVTTGDDDFFARASLFNEARKMRFSVMDLNRRHIS